MNDATAQTSRPGAFLESATTSSVTRSGAVLQGRAVITPADPVTSDADDAYLYDTPLDPQGLRPIGSTVFIGFAVAGAAAWWLFGRKKKRTNRRRK